MLWFWFWTLFWLILAIALIAALAYAVYQIVVRFVIWLAGFFFIPQVFFQIAGIVAAALLVLALLPVAYSASTSRLPHPGVSIPSGPTTRPAATSTSAPATETSTSAQSTATTAPSTTATQVSNPCSFNISAGATANVPAGCFLVGDITYGGEDGSKNFDVGANSGDTGSLVTFTKAAQVYATWGASVYPTLDLAEEAVKTGCGPGGCSTQLDYTDGTYVGQKSVVK